MARGHDPRYDPQYPSYPDERYVLDEPKRSREADRPRQAAIPAQSDPEGVNIAPGHRAGETERQEYINRLGESKKQGYLSEQEHDRRASYMKPEASKALLARLVEDLPTLPELEFTGSQRTSQAERDRFLDHLATCFADGRLSQEQYDRRTTYIHTHKGVTEEVLLGLIQDLPALTPPEIIEEPLWTLLHPKKLRAAARSMKWSNMNGHARLITYVLAIVLGCFLVIAPSVFFFQVGWGAVSGAVAVLAGLLGIALVVMGFVWIDADPRIK